MSASPIKRGATFTYKKNGGYRLEGDDDFIESWYKSMFISYRPVYGHIISDYAIVVANICMVSLSLQWVSFSTANRETCKAPLAYFMGVEIALIVLFQLLPIFCGLFKHAPLRENRTSKIMLFFSIGIQVSWLMVGWFWLYGKNKLNCETNAPAIWNASTWVVFTYSAVIPMQAVWFAVVIFASEQRDPAMLLKKEWAKQPDIVNLYPNRALYKDTPSSGKSRYSLPVSEYEPTETDGLLSQTL